MKMIVLIEFRLLNFDYKQHIYKAYDKCLTEALKPVVIEISSSKDGRIDRIFCAGNENNIAVKLFELYLMLKSFSDWGMEIEGGCSLHMKDYFDWFSGGIEKWSKASIFNALTR